MAASSSAAAANRPSAAEATRGRISERDTTSSSGRMSDTGWFGSTSRTTASTLRPSAPGSPLAVRTTKVRAPTGSCANGR